MSAHLVADIGLALMGLAIFLAVTFLMADWAGRINRRRGRSYWRGFALSASLAVVGLGWTARPTQYVDDRRLDRCRHRRDPPAEEAPRAGTARRHRRRVRLRGGS
jgi:hypothetical protein